MSGSVVKCLQCSKPNDASLTSFIIEGGNDVNFSHSNRSNDTRLTSSPIEEGNDVNSLQRLRSNDLRLVLWHTHSGKLVPPYVRKLIVVASTGMPAPVSRSYSLQPDLTQALPAGE